MTLPIADSGLQETREVAHERLEDVVIRFAGDSGDGMQLTGTQFTSTSALVGNDLATFPDFPAEIRAPAGTLAGVSAFQVHIADRDIHTPGDAPDVLVAMNPAALKVNFKDLKKNGVLIVNTDEFDERSLQKAGYATSPLEDGSLDAYRVFKVEITKLTKETLKDSGLDTKSQERCKNFFALGMIYWLFSRPLEPTLQWVEEKFGGKPKLAAANIAVLKAGWNFGDITELFQVRYEVEPAKLEAGTYRNIMGNTAIALGLIAASQRSGLPLFIGAYPITPATDVLHELSTYKNYGVTTFQAEDEIAAMCATIGASYGGALAVTATSGPGMALKSEAIGLADHGRAADGHRQRAARRPLDRTADQDRAGRPLPGDPRPQRRGAAAGARRELAGRLLRHGGRGLPHRGQVHDAGDPALRRLPRQRIGALAGAEAGGPARDLRKAYRMDPEGFHPYDRDPVTLARPWAIPGTAGLEHRIGGLEKDDGSGHVSYDPDNHEHMIKIRAEKVARVRGRHPGRGRRRRPEGQAPGRSAGARPTVPSTAPCAWRGRRASRSAVSTCAGSTRSRRTSARCSRASRSILIPEINLGQLAFMIRGRFLQRRAELPQDQGQAVLPFRDPQRDQAGPGD